MTKGIDVSAWQGSIDWDKVKADGIKFAILKAGGSDASYPYVDSHFHENYLNAKACGIAVGAYYFVGSDCVTTSAGKAAAARFIDLLSGYKFEYPVYIDVEVTPTANRTGATDATIAFCKAMENAGYFAGIYGSTYSTFQSRLDDSRLTKYAHWVAQYSSSCEYWGNIGIWQYSSSGKVNGIYGNVDMNYSYVDYPALIKKKGLNGFGKTASTAENASNSAKLTVDGSWGVLTTKASQRFLKTYIDGVVSNQLLYCKRFLPACDTSSWLFDESKTGGSEMIRALQKLVGAEVDGYAGEETVKALQRYLNKKNNAGLLVDGYCGKLTVKAWQTYLNK